MASDRDQFARVVQAGISRGMDVVDAWRQARAQRPSAQARALQAEHDRRLAEQQRALRRHQRRQRTLDNEVTGGVAVAGVAGTLGVLDIVIESTTATAGVYGPAWVWVALAAGGGVVAAVARRKRAQLPPAPRVDAIPSAPAAIPAHAIGAEQAQRLAALRLQLAQVIPAIERLHPDAAADLRRADLEAAPQLHALVDRLVVLHGIRIEMAGTQAEAAATSAAVEVRERLTTGCATYERLIAASATMLAAPDIARSTDEVLAPALEGLTAYTHGLKRAANS
ncbi:MAG: hypothetical protein ACOYNJ_06695 [Candidatus Nanopelagicales bacterium]